MEKVDVFHSPVSWISSQSYVLRSIFFSYLKSKQSESQVCIVEGLKLIVDTGN